MVRRGQAQHQPEAEGLAGLAAVAGQLQIARGEPAEAVLECQGLSVEEPALAPLGEAEEEVAYHAPVKEVVVSGTAWQAHLASKLSAIPQVPPSPTFVQELGVALASLWGPAPQDVGLLLAAQRVQGLFAELSGCLVGQWAAAK
eukprot:scaffold1811_cov411-Prasinococcus_capsulatus_cf.AAC.16